MVYLNDYAKQLNQIRRLMEEAGFKYEGRRPSIYQEKDEQDKYSHKELCLLLNMPDTKFYIEQVSNQDLRYGLHASLRLGMVINERVRCDAKCISRHDKIYNMWVKDGALNALLDWIKMHLSTRVTHGDGVLCDKSSQYNTKKDIRSGNKKDGLV